MNKVVLKAQNLDGFLTASDLADLSAMQALFGKTSPVCEKLSGRLSEPERKAQESILIGLYAEMGEKLKDICARAGRIRVYPFSTPVESHGEASRLIAKLRGERTPNREFVYYTQRAFELLFNLAYAQAEQTRRNHLIVKSPVDKPCGQFAVHKIPDVDALVESSVMCVMLRGALLPSMIMSKEIQEYSSNGYITPFALFKIKRDESKNEGNMEYVLDLDRSYFDLGQLDGKDLIFADPMNATGGSLVTVVKHILDQGVKPRSIKCFHVISALKGALRCVRAVPNLELYTLWMDPALNDLAYILPGLGDAGDRINGKDESEQPRDILQLIADYGVTICDLYRSQIRKIEETVLRRRG
jgi:uracil phosphoribosyltransferase